MQILLPTIPPPCQRGRLTQNGHFFSPTRGKEQMLALEMMSILSHQKPAPQYPILGPCSVSITYTFGAKKETLIIIEPLNFEPFAPPGDIDNRDKTVLDSLQKAHIFQNDSQVYQLNAMYQLV